MFAHRKVLVLDQSYTPVNVVTLERALKKITKRNKDGSPKAEIIDCANNCTPFTWEDWLELQPMPGEDVMRSPSATLRVPVIIRYTQHRKQYRRTQYNRRSVYRRDDNTCQYCGVKYPMQELSLDHVIPRCQGGLTAWDNIVVACTKCNTKKAGRTPQEAKMQLRRHPKKPLNNFLPEVIHKDWIPFLEGQAV